MIVLLKCLLLSWKFRGYLPSRTDFWAVREYVYQFRRADRGLVVEMLRHVRFFSASETRSEFEKLILGLRSKCMSEGLSDSSVIILPASDIGASSVEMFVLAAKICDEHNIKFQFYSGAEVLELRRKVKGLARCVLVFVDDFAGSGRQFDASVTRKWSSVTSMSGVTSILMTAVICSEAIYRLRARGIELRFAYEHGLGERFHSLEDNLVLGDGFKTLCSYARELHNKEPVGYKDMGCMVVMYRNSSNNMPLLLRGTKGQRIWRGLFPRRDQLAHADHEILPPRA